ncbi:ROK family transcriptional regulator [Kushneria aurantia]|uniref:ROK family protein n=1 Tax=Kushneria aurantia TaxID=504092 RepID=A0ABV6G5N1_9GAMM|nr:ROK family transcriptional regulator [Kushneria aurantia]
MTELQSIIGRRSDRDAKTRFIINTLRSSEKLSRSAIAEHTGLSPTTVSSIISALLDEGLVVEEQALDSRGGRRPTPLRLNYTAHTAVGIRLRADSIECMLTDMAALPLGRLELPLTDHSPETVCATCETAVIRLLNHYQDTSRQLVGVGVAIPGVIDSREGICRRSYRLGWQEVAFAPMLEKRLGVPVRVDDDSHAFALAHTLFGAGLTHASFAAVAIGEGISCDMVLNRQVHRGDRGAAGKLGHTFWQADGPRCECGRSDCLQARYALPGMLALWQQQGGDPYGGLAEMKKALDRGELQAGDVVQQAGLAIGQCLASFVTVIDLDHVVIGGEAIALGDQLIAPIKAQLQAHCFYDTHRIEIDSEKDLWRRGAAALVTQMFFNF